MSDAPQTEEERAAAAAATAQAHREKFAQSADDGTPNAPASADPVVHEKPEHVPEKFFNKDTGEVNYEAWNKAHSELESKFHQGSSNADGESEETPASDEGAPAGDSEEKPEEVKAILETPAAQAAADYYAENGELSETHYAAMEKQGIGRELVDTYITGQEAKASAITDAVFGPTGGEENYQAMIAWSAESLSSVEKKAFNSQMKTGDPEVMSAAVTGLYAKYSETANIEGERTGGAAPSTNSSTFASRREMTAAINKVGEDGRRLYDIDPAYRNEVARKIGASRKAGTVNF